MTRPPGLSWALEELGHTEATHGFLFLQEGTAQPEHSLGPAWGVVGGHWPEGRQLPGGQAAGLCPVGSRNA